VIYSLLRGAAGIALRWYYADVTITRDWLSSANDDEDLLRTAPLLVVVNHPNALVDVLIAGRAVPRRLLFTAKSTLFSNSVSRVLLSAIGVVPLRRSTDETDGRPDPSRNAAVFNELARALSRRQAILIFPEGRSHDEPAIAPLKTGVARIALHAKTHSGVRQIRVLPIGLIFQRKDVPRSRALAIIGESLDLDSWVPQSPASAVDDLTAEIDARLRSITLNYASADEARSQTVLATRLAALIRYEAPSVGVSGDLRGQATIARLLPKVRDALKRGDSHLQRRGAELEAQVESFHATLDAHRISLNDLTISRELRPGVHFVFREGILLLLAGPVALWGWVNHLIPFRAALIVGKRTRASAADPAMRTIVAGVAFVLMMYMLQSAVVAFVAGPWWALAYVISLPLAADVNLRLRERLGRAIRRARTYLLFRTRPALQQQLETTAARLRDEALALARAAGV
jgi:glycerol-3-phosphate O-acyltransferase / dihydroxyacetone phosphate acyltransferase